jgi:hypothetical protein
MKTELFYVPGLSSGVEQSHRDFSNLDNFREQENLHGVDDLDNMLLEELRTQRRRRGGEGDREGLKEMDDEHCWVRN